MGDYPNNYKITSIGVLMSYDKRLIIRKTYSLLEFLGDLGGLNEALTRLATFLIGFYETLQYFDIL
jgi:hypothetical protein